MESVYKNLGAVIGFSVIALLVQNFVGEKASQYMILLTLFTMLLINSEKLVSFAESFQ